MWGELRLTCLSTVQEEVPLVLLRCETGSAWLSVASEEEQDWFEKISWSLTQASRASRQASL